MHMSCMWDCQSIFSGSLQKEASMSMPQWLVFHFLSYGGHRIDSLIIHKETQLYAQHDITTSCLLLWEVSSLRSFGLSTSYSSRGMLNMIETHQNCLTRYISRQALLLYKATESSCWWFCVIKLEHMIRHTSSLLDWWWVGLTIPKEDRKSKLQ